MHSILQATALLLSTKPLFSEPSVYTLDLKIVLSPAAWFFSDLESYFKAQSVILRDQSLLLGVHGILWQDKLILGAWI